MASKKELKARIKELEGSRVAWTEACVQRTREADEHYERQKQAEARVAELEAELAAERAKAPMYWPWLPSAPWIQEPPVEPYRLITTPNTGNPEWYNPWLITS